MPERDGQNSFTAKPTIRNNSDEVEWRKRIKNGNKHLYNVIFFAVFSEILQFAYTGSNKIRKCLLFEEEIFVMQNDFTVDILHKDPKSFGFSVNFIIPFKVRRDGKFHA
jgi:hypothetical protein